MSGYVLYQILNLIMIMCTVFFLKILYDRLDAAENRYLFIAALGVILELIGWFSISHCTDIGVAMSCLRVTILGRCLFEAGYTLYIGRIFDSKVQKAIATPVILVLTLAFIHTLTPGNSNPFLAKEYLVNKDGIVLLLGTRGWNYYLHAAFFGFIGFWCFVLSVKTLINPEMRKNTRLLINSRFNIITVTLEGLALLVYEFNYDSFVNFIPLSRAFFMGIYAFISVRVNILNYDTLAGKSLIKGIGAGFAVLSNRYEVMFVNDIAKAIFPKLSENDTQFNRELTKRREFQHESNDKTYKISVDRIFEDSRVEGYTVLMTDITDIVELEKQTIANEKTRQNLLTNISHELRTPLNALSGAAEMLISEDVQGDAFKNYAEIIRVSSINLNDILGDILTASSSYEKVSTSDMVPYSLYTLADNIIGMCNERVAQKKIKFTVSISEDIPINAIGDDSRIRQVVLCILTNAIRYTDEGYISLRITGEMLKDGRFEYIYNIQDTGRNVFKKDVNLSEALEDDELGMGFDSGYGISILVAKKIANALDGDVSMYSVQGKGNVYNIVLPSQILDESSIKDLNFADKYNITFLGGEEEMFEDLRLSCYELGVTMEYIPGISRLRRITDMTGKKNLLFYDYGKFGKKVDSSERTDGYIKVAVITSGGLPNDPPGDCIFMYTPLSTLSIQKIYLEEQNRNLEYENRQAMFLAPSAKVLVVDDNPFNLDVAKNHLERFQISVDTATSGFECMELIASGQKYDLIYMDYMMEGLDGIETTRKIRNIDSSIANVPIVAYTANNVEGAYEMYIAAGMNDCIFKPASLKDFSDSLKKYLPKELQIFDTLQKEADFHHAIKAFPNIIGVDKETAVKYSGGNLNLFKEMISTFVNEIPAKEKSIIELAKAEDYKNFVVTVHGVKSISRTMGITKLADQMARMEKAGKEEDRDYIESNMQELLSTYKKYGTVLSKYAAKKKQATFKADNPKVVNTLVKMLELIDDFELDKAEKLFAEIAEGDYDGERSSLFENLKDSIERADYYESREFADKLLKTYEA